MTSRTTYIIFFFLFVCFFFNDTANTEIYTLSLHDALPICRRLKYRQITAKPREEKSKLEFRNKYRPSMEHLWKKASYDRLMLQKAHLQTEKVSEELVLTEA